LAVTKMRRGVVQVEHSEQVEGNAACELQLGRGSWDGESKAIKYAWPDSRGRWVRGGEFPADVLGQMIVFALREGYLDPLAIVDAVGVLAERGPSQGEM
jgi:hypothetical protein